MELRFGPTRKFLEPNKELHWKAQVSLFGSWDPPNLPAVQELHTAQLQGSQWTPPSGLLHQPGRTALHSHMAVFQKGAPSDC